MSSGRILVVDDEVGVTESLRLVLAERGYAVMSAGSVAGAAALCEGDSFDLIFTDLMLPDATGLDLLSRIKSDGSDAEVILMTGHGSLDVAIAAIKSGAFYYMEKPFTCDQVRRLAEQALQFLESKRGKRAPKGALPGAEDYGIIGQHPTIRQLHQIICTAAPSDAPVLIEGETGTGKELVAAAIHRRGRRSGRPFIGVNCAAIPSDLIESELFGYRKGAFTGAARDKRGLIEAAAGGTLLLDEIGEMPAHLQTKLLRVLQERRLRRLGDEEEVEVDFRLVSATNCDTGQMIAEGSLRKDLFFRISTVRLRVPPLRERLDDLPLLCEHFLRRYAEKYGKSIHGISPSTYTLLVRYDWPGNVRELEGAVEHAVLFARDEQLMPEDLPEQLHVAEPGQSLFVIPSYLTFEEVEREVILQMLKRTGGNVRKTARLLQLHRPRLYRKLKKLGLQGKDGLAEAVAPAPRLSGVEVAPAGCEGDRPPGPTSPADALWRRERLAAH